MIKNLHEKLNDVVVLFNKKLELEADIQKIRDALSMTDKASKLLLKGDETSLIQLGFTKEHINALKRNLFLTGKIFPTYVTNNNKKMLKKLEKQLKELISK